MGVDLPSKDIPAIAELAQLKQWVCWTKQKRNGRDTKIPYNANTQKPASAVNPSDWCSYDDAHSEASNRSYCDGIGFVFSEGDGYVGIDLDKCVDPATMEIEPWAYKICETMSSYTEYSPSGNGLHIYVKAEVNTDGRRHERIEVYSCKRYFTVTGKIINCFPEEINTTDKVQALIDTFPAHVQTEAYAADEFDLQAEVSTLKFETLLENNTTFKKTWNHKRPKLGDQSNSSYDLSLASQALIAGWSDQEVASLLVLHRAKWGDPQGKAKRQDYIRRTIQQAHNNLMNDVPEKDSAQIAQGEAALSAGGREALEELSSRFGFHITRAIKRGRTESMYYLVNEEGTEIRIGQAIDLNTERIPRAAIIDATGRVPNRLKGSKWDMTVQIMLSVVEEEDVGDAESAVSMANLILEYVQQQTPLTWENEDNKDALIITMSRPFIRDSSLWFQADTFRDWLQKAMGLRYVKKDLILTLKEMGCAGGDHSRREKGTVKNRYYWGLSLEALNAIAGKRTTGDEEDGDETPF